MKITKNKIVFTLLTLALLLPFQNAQTIDHTQYWIKIKATDKFQRSVIADKGVSIEITRDDYVIAIGNLEELHALEKLGWVETSFALTRENDFPSSDSAFHNYQEMRDHLSAINKKNPQITQLINIGKSTEGRDMVGIRISGDLANADQMPGIILMGGHHAREHLSVELPIMFAEYLVDQYNAGNQKIIALVDHREINIIPAINPDGVEYDVSSGDYKMWRKNRSKNSDGTYGVDLNRNYGYAWGTGGSSKNPNSETYMGTKAFSEPETQAVKKFVEANENTTILLSLHTYSQLILYPWGNTYDSIANTRDKQVHETMARKMATWNGYTPQQSSDLYIASGDTTDWAYGERKIISFTFELDPGQYGGGGFYPGAGVIKPVFEKNLEPMLYLLGYADNPYRVLDSGGIIRP